MQAQFKIYEIRSWGQDSSPSYFDMELLQLTREPGWRTQTQKQKAGTLQNRAQTATLKYLRISVVLKKLELNLRSEIRGKRASLTLSTKLIHNAIFCNILCNDPALWGGSGCCYIQGTQILSEKDPKRRVPAPLQLLFSVLLVLVNEQFPADQVLLWACSSPFRRRPPKAWPMPIINSGTATHVFHE